MDPEELKHKIMKYTHKLKKAATYEEAEVYQEKLRYYHRLNYTQDIVDISEIYETL